MILFLFQSRNSNLICSGRQIAGKEYLVWHTLNPVFKLNLIPLQWKKTLCQFLRRTQLGQETLMAHYLKVSLVTEEKQNQWNDFKVLQTGLRH